MHDPFTALTLPMSLYLRTGKRNLHNIGGSFPNYRQQAKLGVAEEATDTTVY